MTTVVSATMTIARDEYQDMSVLLAPTAANVADDLGWVLAAPDGFGDYLFLEGFGWCQNMTAFVNTAADLVGMGVLAVVADAGGVPIAPVGFSALRRVNNATGAGEGGMGFYVKPDQATIIRAQDRLTLIVPLLNVVAGATGDLRFWARVKRLRLPLP